MPESKATTQTFIVADFGAKHAGNFRRLNPAIPEEVPATDKEPLSVQNTPKGG